jgi:TonB family protein
VALCDELDRAPSLKFAPQPKFPEKAIRDGREGQVGLLFVVDAAGAVVPNSIQVVFSDGDEFAKAAIEVIRRARFLPGARGGKAVRALAGQRVSFRMDSEAATPRGTAPAPLPPSTRPVTPDRP